MKTSYLIASSLLIFVLLLSGCNFPGTEKTTELSPELAIQTSAAQTVEAISTVLAATKPAAPPPVITQAPLGQASTAVSVPPVPTVAPTNAPTVPPTLPPVPTVPVVVPTVIPCDRAQFVADVTVPDGTTYAPNSSFTKTWRLANNGSCTWSTSYQLVFDSGNAMNGPAAVALPASVPPGSTVDLSVNLKAPATNGEYTGSWKLQNASGVRFGIGAMADKAFWVNIKVGTTASVTPSIFAVTHAGASANPSNYSGACPVTITFTAEIKTSGAGTVTYHWERNDGGKGSTETLTYDSAGTKTVTTTWTMGGAGFTYSGWEKVYIDTPNHQYFSPANFSITCNP
jgi:hypothetical protein